MSMFIPGGNAISVKAHRVIEAIEMIAQKTNGLSVSSEYETKPEGTVEFSATHFSRGLSDLINLLSVDGRLHFTVTAKERWIEFSVPVREGVSASRLAAVSRRFRYAGCIPGVDGERFFVTMTVDPTTSLALYDGTSRDLSVLILLGLDLDL